MKRELTKPQEELLMLLCEGEITHSTYTDMNTLEDGDGNVYCVRRDTFDKLLTRQFICRKRKMNEEMEVFGLTKKAETYLNHFHSKFVREFVSRDPYADY